MLLSPAIAYNVYGIADCFTKDKKKKCEGNTHVVKKTGLCPRSFAIFTFMDVI